LSGCGKESYEAKQEAGARVARGGSDPARPGGNHPARGTDRAGRAGDVDGRRGVTGLRAREGLLHDDRRAGRGGAARANEKAGYFHSLLFKRLSIHTIPHLVFVHDESVERGIEIDRLIDEAKPGPGPLRPGRRRGQGARRTCRRSAVAGQAGWHVLEPRAAEGAATAECSEGRTHGDPDPMATDCCR